MVFELFATLSMAWKAYDNFSTAKKIWKSLGLTKDYLILKWKNPEVFVSLEKIYFVDRLSKESMERISERILTDLETTNGLRSIAGGIEFESKLSHIRYTIEEKSVDSPGTKQKLVVLKTDTKLYYPFRQRAILNRLQDDFYKIGEIISSAYNFDKSNEIINVELNIENIERDIKHEYVINNSKIIYKNKKIQINTFHKADNYPLIITSLLLWYLRFPEVKFKKTTQIVE